MITKKYITYAEGIQKLRMSTLTGVKWSPLPKERKEKLNETDMEPTPTELQAAWDKCEELWGYPPERLVIEIIAYKA